MLTLSRASVRTLRALFGVVHRERSALRQVQADDFNRRNRSWSDLALPDGWFIVLRSSELPRRGVASIQIRGRDLVAFRTSAGSVGVLDAFCPHLGADLRGGKVKREELICPFHGLAWRTDGGCDNRSSLSSAGHVSTTPAYPVLERNNSIHIWMSDTNALPTWEPPQFELDLVELSRKRELVNCHLAVESMACFDDEHGFYAHRTVFDRLRFRTLPELNRILLDDAAPHTLGVEVVLEHRHVPLTLRFRAMFYGPAICSAQLSVGASEHAPYVQGRTYTGLVPLSRDAHIADNAVYVQRNASRSDRAICAILAFWVHTVMHSDDVAVWDYMKFNRGGTYYDRFWDWYDRFLGP